VNDWIAVEVIDTTDESLAYDNFHGINSLGSLGKPGLPPSFHALARRDELLMMVAVEGPGELGPFSRCPTKHVSKMAVDRPFPKGTFKVELGPGKHEVSVIFKPTQSTIVFSRPRPGVYQVHHTRPGQFGRFDEAAVVGAARELALALVGKVGPR